METVRTSFKIAPQQGFHYKRKNRLMKTQINIFSRSVTNVNHEIPTDEKLEVGKDAESANNIVKYNNSKFSPTIGRTKIDRKAKVTTTVKGKSTILKTSSLGNLTVKDSEGTPKVNAKSPKTDKSTMLLTASASSSISSKTNNTPLTKKQFKRMNSSPSVILKVNKTDETKVTNKNEIKISNSLGNKVKMVRIDEDVQIRHIGTGKKKSIEKMSLVRSNSFEGSQSIIKSCRQKNLDSFYPRRRFSQSATESIRELFEEIEQKARKKKDIIKNKLRSQDQENLSRVDRRDLLEDQSSFYYEDDCLDWVALKSLTGKNVSGWKFQDNFYGVINMGKRGRPSMDTAWGRRIYDQYEIELESDKPRNKYLTDLDPLREPRELGLWDLIFNPEIIPQLECSQKWDPLREEKQKELRRLKIDPSRLDEELVISEDSDDPLNKFKLKFMRTGEYLRPHDMRFCVERTNFTEEQIIGWFRRFRRDCPDGRLTKDNLRTLFRLTFPDGNAEKFSNHIMRIFDSDGNDFLDFKEFLIAMDISTCETEESKLEWAFKLYDFDNNGCIEVNEMIKVMETLESLECTHRRRERKISYDEFGNLVRVPTPEERARDLFVALDREGTGFLTVDKFVQGYMERNELLARQDAQEQKRNLDSLILKGPAIPDSPPSKLGPLQPSPKTKTPDATLEVTANDSYLKVMVCGLLCKRASVDCNPEDIDIVSLRQANEETPKSVFVRFSNKDIRMKVWAGRGFARKCGLYMEEHLTLQRQKIWGKCADLKNQGKIREFWTKNGDIFVQFMPPGPAKMLVVTDSQFENLLKITKGVINILEIGDSSIKWEKEDDQCISKEDFPMS